MRITLIRPRFAEGYQTSCGWSLATYLAYNPLFRGELLKKHGMTLGYRGYERT